MSESLSLRGVRRLALARGGLLDRRWTGLPSAAPGRGARARKAALDVVGRFGYLQLDTVSIAGARSHALVLLSRLEGMDPTLGEELLQPGEPLFEYWGHEASWLPLELYPVFAFRREDFQVHPWWGDLLSDHQDLADGLIARMEEEGPLRALDFEGEGSTGWWQLKLAKKVASALWSAGRIAVSERKGFQRTFDLVERVIPAPLREQVVPRDEAIRRLALLALSGHGWATAPTIAATWRLRTEHRLATALEELREAGHVVPAAVTGDDGKKLAGWIRAEDLERIPALERMRPRKDSGVLLSPFDPLLWDRRRVSVLFGFDQVLEIFKRAEHRVWGYYCLPVLVGERLVARIDLKAHRNQGRLEVLALHWEQDPPSPEDRQATETAIQRYADAVRLRLDR